MNTLKTYLQISCMPIILNCLKQQFFALPYPFETQLYKLYSENENTGWLFSMRNRNIILHTHIKRITLNQYELNENEIEMSLYSNFIILGSVNSVFLYCDEKHSQLSRFAEEI